MKRSRVSTLAVVLFLAALALPAQDASQIRKIMHLDGFRPTPGDVYTLTINFGVSPQPGQTQSTETVELMLGQDFRLDVPYIGVVDASDLSYEQLQATVTAEVKERVLASFVALNLTAPAVFDVFVWGSVGAPGFHALTSINRLFDLLATAGNISQSGSRRRIELHRDGQTQVFDLVGYLSDGDESQNPFLRPGDRVFVPVARAGVELRGAVVQPGPYEVLPGDTIGDVIDLAGGFLPTAELDSATISRLNEQNRYSLVETEFDSLVSLEARNGDVIIVPSTTTTSETVLIEGAIHAGPAEAGQPREVPLEPILLEVPYAPGLTVLRLLEEFGGPTNFARLERSFIIRGRDNLREPIPDLGVLWEERQWDRDIVMQPGDRLVVPMKRLVVAVGGEVTTAGAFPFTSGYTVGDYLELAGGVSEDGTFNELFFAESDGTLTRVDVDTPVPIGANIYVGRDGLARASKFFGDFFMVTGWVTGIMGLVTTVINFIQFFLDFGPFAQWIGT